MYRVIHALVFLGVLFACLPHAGVIASSIVALEATVATFVLLVFLKFEYRLQVLFAASLVLCGLGAMALGAAGTFGWPPIAFAALAFALPLIGVAARLLHAVSSVDGVEHGEV